MPAHQSSSRPTFFNTNSHALLRPHHNLPSPPPHPPKKKSKHTQDAPCTYLPVRLRVRPPIFKDGHLGIPRIGLEALRDRIQRGRARGLA